MRGFFVRGEGGAEADGDRDIFGILIGAGIDAGVIAGVGIGTAAQGSVDIGRGQGPIAVPLPDIAGEIVDPVGIWRETAYGGSRGALDGDEAFIVAFVAFIVGEIGGMAEVICLGVLDCIAPRVAFVCQAPASGILPFWVGGQAIPGEGGVEFQAFEVFSGAEGFAIDEIEGGSAFFFAAGVAPFDAVEPVDGGDGVIGGFA